MEQQSHTDTDSSFIQRVKIDTSASLIFSFFFSFFLPVHTAFIHFPKEQAEKALSQGMCLQVAH